MASAAFPAPLRDWIRHGRVPEPESAEQAAQWVTAAAEQGLAGLLASAVRGNARWPGAAANALRNHYAWGLRQAVCQGDSARRMRELLASRGIRTLPLKGAALNTRLYDSPAERPMVDVDLLVLEGWSDALATVGTAGWRVADEGDHAVAFEDPRTGVMIELHHSLTSCAGFHPIDAEGLWERSRPTEDGDRLPAAEDVLVHISVHAAFQHGFAVSLVQLLDVRRLLERSTVDVAALANIARAARASHAVGATLRLAGELVAAPVSPELEAAFVHGLPRGLSRWLSARIAAGTVLHESGAALARARWELAAGRRLELLRATLSPASARHRERTGVLLTLKRAVHLVRRWGVPAVAAARATRRV